VQNELLAHVATHVVTCLGAWMLAAASGTGISCYTTDNIALPAVVLTCGRVLVAASGTGIICYTIDNMGQKSENLGQKKAPLSRGLVDQLLDQC